MHYPQKKKVIYSRIKEHQFHLSFGWRPLEVAKVYSQVRILHKCTPRGQAGSGQPGTAVMWGALGRAGAKRLQTCFESGVRRLRLAVEMVREMLIPANWRLLLPRMLESTLLGGCEISRVKLAFHSLGPHCWGLSAGHNPNLCILPALNM